MKLPALLLKLLGTSDSKNVHSEARISPLEEAELILEEPHLYCAERSCQLEIFGRVGILYFPKTNSFYHDYCLFPGRPSPENTLLLDYSKAISFYRNGCK